MVMTYLTTLASVAVVVVVVAVVVDVVDAFGMVVVPSSSSRATTRRKTTTRRRTTTSTTTSTVLFLEDWVADMIDGELYRQNHKGEYEEQWMAKNKNAILHSLNQGASREGQFADGALMMDPVEDYRMRRKDVKMAMTAPEKYCADRCLATGNCDVYEDFFDMSPQRVMEFCEECVLSDGEEPCDVPDAFYDLYDDLGGSHADKLHP